MECQQCFGRCSFGEDFPCFPTTVSCPVVNLLSHFLDGMFQPKESLKWMGESRHFAELMGWIFSKLKSLNINILQLGIEIMEILLFIPYINFCYLDYHRGGVDIKKH